MISPALAPLLRSGESWDDATALALAEHAAACYGSPHEYHAAARGAGYRDPVVIEQGATQVGACVTSRGLVVACRGSSERLDWRENAAAWRVRWPGVVLDGGVHYGFRLQTERMRRQLAANVSAALDGRTEGVPMFVTGHSLGGAIAPLVALCLAADLGLRLAALYTFESPRPGNEAFSRWWDRAAGGVTHRVVVIRDGEADIVTRVPPSACGWWHIGRPQMIRAGVRYESEAEWERVRADHPESPLPRWRVLSRLVRSIKAHSMTSLLLTLRMIYGRGKRMESLPLEVLT